MKNIIIILNAIGLLAILNGCLYRNDCGYGNAVWDNKTYYYDAQGNYREKCPDNVIYNDESLRQNQDQFEETIY